MHAIHIWWSKSTLQKYDRYFLEDYELLLMIISALSWKYYQQKPIYLFCDTTFKNYLDDIGILKLKIWNEVDTNIVDTTPDIINPSIYFKAPMFYVFKQLNTSFVVLDHDTYLKNKIIFNRKYDLLAMHKEKLLLYQYPPFENISNLNQFSWTEDPINACFLWFQNLELVHQYFETAIQYIEDPTHNIEDSTECLRMLFIEQRLLAEIAKDYNVKCLINDIWYDDCSVFTGFLADKGPPNSAHIHETLLTHQWGEKTKMYDSFYHYQHKISEYLTFFDSKYTFLKKHVIESLIKARQKINYIENIYQKYL